jgi:hypothetical protein
MNFEITVCLQGFDLEVILLLYFWTWNTSIYIYRSYFKRFETEFTPSSAQLTYELCGTPQGREFLRHRVRISSRGHPASYPMGIGGKADGA